MTSWAPSGETNHPWRTCAPAVWADAFLPALVLVLIIAGGATGCASRRSSSAAAPAQSSDTSVRDMTPAEIEFANGSKRVPTAKTLYALSQLLAGQGKQEQSEFILRKIIAEYPKFMPAYCDLAEWQMRQRHIEEAISTLSAGLKLVPTDAVLANDRGMCFMLLRDYENALKDFTLATAVAPDNARYRSNMAAAVGMLGRYEESLALYKQVMPVADAHHNLGVLCDARGDHQRAELEYRMANPAAAGTASVAKTAAPPAGKPPEAPTAMAHVQQIVVNPTPVVVVQAAPPVAVVVNPTISPSEEDDTVFDGPNFIADETPDALSSNRQISSEPEESVADAVDADDRPTATDAMSEPSAQLAAAQVTPANSDDPSSDTLEEPSEDDAAGQQPVVSGPATNPSDFSNTRDTDDSVSEQNPDPSNR